MGRTPTIAAIFGFAAGLLFAGLLLSPRIIERTPADSTSTAWPNIAISSNRALNRGSLGDGLQLEPAVPGSSLLLGQEIRFASSTALQYNRRYTVTLSAGVRGANGLPLLGDRTWSFAVGQPELVYLRQQGEQANLWVHTGVNQARQLTFETAVVWDYNAAADGRGWIISIWRDERGSELVRIDRRERRHVLVRCPDAHCRDGRLQPGGDLLAYERHPIDVGPGASEIWLLEMATMTTFPAADVGGLTDVALSGAGGRFPRWSHDGRYLAYYRPDRELIVFLDLVGDKPAAVPAVGANLGDWSPDGYRLATTQLAFGERQPHGHVDDSGVVITHTRPSLYNHLVLAGPRDESAVDLSEGLEVDESVPSWSPDGRWLAVARSATGAGRQIWILAVDGSESRQLTDDPLFHHSSLSWSPDGQRLAYMRSPAGDMSAPSEVWTVDLETGAMSLAATGAFLPGWRP